MWTKFFDMSSGGDEKEDFVVCYIEAPEEEAVIFFERIFWHHPYRETCSHCGPDYSSRELDSTELKSMLGEYENEKVITKEDLLRY